MLPAITSLDAYRQVYRNEQTWLPALRAICQRHGLEAASLHFAPPGSHVVFWVEQDWLIKLFCPLWQDDACTEALVLQELSDLPAFQVPRIRAQGEIEGWPYLVLSRLPGVSLDLLWGTLQPEEKLGIASSLGRLMAALHQTPTTRLQTLYLDWPAFLTEQQATFVERQRLAGISPAWLAECTAFLAELPPLYEPGFMLVLLNADLNPEHLFCELKPGGWQITGIIDFGDAMLGHPYYEFIAPGFIFKDSPELLRAMLLAYGFTSAALNESLSRSLLGYTLLHRFANLPDWLSLFGEPPPRNLLALQKTLWALD